MGNNNLYDEMKRKDSWKDIELNSAEDIPKAVEQKAEGEPVTIGEVHKAAKDKGIDVSRSTVKNTMNSMAEDHKLKAKKPMKKASKIFWKNGD